MPDSLAGQQIAIDPNEQVCAMLDNEDLVVSESMIFDAMPEQDQVILNGALCLGQDLEVFAGCWSKGVRILTITIGSTR